MAPHTSPQVTVPVQGLKAQVDRHAAMTQEAAKKILAGMTRAFDGHGVNNLVRVSQRYSLTPSAISGVVSLATRDEALRFQIWSGPKRALALAIYEPDSKVIVMVTDRAGHVLFPPAGTTPVELARAARLGQQE